MQYQLPKTKGRKLWTIDRDEMADIASRIWYGRGHQRHGEKVGDPTLLGIDLGATPLIDIRAHKWEALDNGFTVYIETPTRGPFRGRITVRRG